MEKYLVDTSVLIAHLRGFTPATAFLLQEEKFMVSYVTIAELMQGAKSSGDMQRINRFIATLSIHSGSEKINRHALILVRLYHLQHGALLMDMLLAATALSANLTLLTDNIKDFRFIPGLKVQKPPYT